ncbi:hypothetical protein Q604_UNBC18533G0009 [human gut metagenome]|uniref:VWFA domain-containing protein n=1 Tax=human gut metagenome TaxID=408170 RepID=W1WSA9_9ZZZZ
MKNRLTKFFTVFLAVVLCIGMAPATGSTAYAASRWGGSSISSWWNSWFGGSNSGSNNNNSSSNSNQAGENDATSSNSSTVDLNQLGGSGSNDAQLSLTKSITHKDGDNYTIRLEAYATGEVKTTTQTTDVPTDIVLVLDQSGSMADKMYNYEAIYSVDTQSSYYIKVNNQWQALKYKNGSWYYGNWPNRQYVTPKTSKDDTDSNHTQFYTRTEQTRLAALKAAVNTFVTEIQNKAASSKAKYRVAIVGFGMGESDTWGYDNYENTELFIGGTQYTYGSNNISAEYKNAFQDMSTTTGQNNIRDSINALAARGATRADLGMTMANNIFNANPISKDEKRNRVVVMFTDGEPNDGSGFSNTVATNTISQSNTSKNTYKASVYTIGILDGANTTDTTSNINRYMNYVSSNFPNATGLNQSGTGGDVTKGFYKKADDAAELKNAFESISSSIESGSTSVTLNQNSVLRDVISDDFSLPANADKNSIVVKTADYAGKNNDGTLKWSNESIFGDAKVDISGKTINVSNFNYNQLFAATVGGKNQGKKLIVEIPVTINRNFGANNVLSNASAGIYPLADSKDAFITVESPEGSHPTEYGVKGTEQWKRSGASVTLESLIDYVTVDGFEYKPDGIKNKDVDIVYTITTEDGTTEVGTYTIPAGKTVDEGTITLKDDSAISNLTKDTVYKIKATVTPKTLPTDADKECGRQAEEKEYTATSYVHIYDTVNKAFIIDFGKPVTYTADKVFDSSNELNAQITLNSGNGHYGNLTIDNEKSITYTLKSFMDGIDTFTFKEVFNKDITLNKTITMIPGTSIYYEDNFENVDENGQKSFAITYDKNWTVLDKDTVEGDSIQEVLGDGETGYDSNYNKDDSKLSYSAGTIHMVQAPSNATAKATFEFTGTGVDIYSLTSATTGKIQVAVWKQKEDGTYPKTAIYRKTIDTKYNSGTAYQLPVVNFRGDETTAKYKVQITVGKGQTFYLDAVRIYNPIGNVNNNYGQESGVKYVSIRQQSLNPTKFTVTGDVFIDKYLENKAQTITLSDSTSKDIMNIYTNYGRKTEVVIAPGKTVTLTLKEASDFLELGARIDAEAPTSVAGGSSDGTVTVNGNPINVNSSTDMYYTISAKDNKIIKITNNTDKLIAITNLKLK